MNKQAIRLTYRQKRLDIASPDKALRSKEIQAQFFTDNRILTCLERTDAVVQVESAPARELDWSAMIEKEPITVMLSQRGWVRAIDRKSVV